MKGSTVIIGAGLIGYFAYRTYIKATNAANGMRVYVQGIGLPRIASNMISVPVSVAIDNHSPTSVPIQALFVTIEKKSGDAWAYLASSQPDLTNIVLPAQGRKMLNLQLEGSALDIGKDLWDTFKNLGKNQYRVKVEARIVGIQLATESTYTV
ncbi:MAG TPA: hypothetical protein VK927_03145 [Adhaeribacter sp.]|nr:hypothetical protein [Adhaeribacter sp.]